MKATVYYPPVPKTSVKDVTVFHRPSVFLAGSIEMGQAERWQDWTINKLSDLEVSIFNPRRNDYDPTWDQSLNCKPFVAQVDWELDHLARVSVAAFYFAPGTKAPITFFELGLTIGEGKYRRGGCTVWSDSQEPQPIIIYCPNGFWRKGNVDVIAKRNGLMVHETPESWVAHLRQVLLDQLV